MRETRAVFLWVGFCLLAPGCRSDTATPRCRNSEECRPTEVCVMGMCQQCRTAGDCRGLCREGRCVSCQNSTECGEGRYCDEGNCKTCGAEKLTVKQVSECVKGSVGEIALVNYQWSGNGLSCGQGVARGTGFVISPDGLVVTNHHVVVHALQGAFKDAETGEQRKIERLVLLDPINDLAVIKVEGNGSRPLKLGSVENARPGNKVFALGAFGTGVGQSTGQITNILKAGNTVQIQHTAITGPGASGGPLFDEMSRVIGVNEAIIASTESSYAVAADYVSLLLEQGPKVNMPLSRWYDQNSLDRHRVSVAKTRKCLNPGELFALGRGIRFERHWDYLFLAVPAGDASASEIPFEVWAVGRTRSGELGRAVVGKPELLSGGRQAVALTAEHPDMLIVGKNTAEQPRCVDLYVDLLVW